MKIVSEKDASSGKKIVLGTIKSSCRIKIITKEGTLKIGNVSSEDDGFHLKSVGPDMVMAVANPRGVLYAVYRLEDWLREDRPNHKSLDIFEVPYFKMRLMPCIPNDKEAIKYLSRLGVNTSSRQILPTALHEYVESDVFPNIIDRKRLCHNKTELRSILDLFKMYGIDAYLWPICEPIVLKKKDSPSDCWWQSGVANYTNFAAGQGNITNDPQFVSFAGENYRLSANSPCVNAGSNQNCMTNSVDLDGRQRIRYGAVDMGAYETIYEGTMYRMGF